MTKNIAECFHRTMYHQWYANWQKDMKKHYSDKRKVVTRKLCN